MDEAGSGEEGEPLLGSARCNAEIRGSTDAREIRSRRLNLGLRLLWPVRRRLQCFNGYLAQATPGATCQRFGSV